MRNSVRLMKTLLIASVLVNALFILFPRVEDRAGLARLEERLDSLAQADCERRAGLLTLKHLGDERYQRPNFIPIIPAHWPKHCQGVNMIPIRDRIIAHRKLWGAPPLDFLLHPDFY